MQHYTEIAHRTILSHAPTHLSRIIMFGPVKLSDISITLNNYLYSYIYSLTVWGYNTQIRVLAYAYMYIRVHAVYIIIYNNDNLYAALHLPYCNSVARISSPVVIRENRASILITVQLRQQRYSVL